MRFLVLTALSVLAAVLLTFPSFTRAQTEIVDTTITIDNAASNAYVLTASEGEGIGKIGEENAVWTF